MKPDKQDELTAILIIQNAVDHILSQPEYLELSDAVQAKIERFLAPLAKRKQALLSPAPSKPRKPSKPKAAVPVAVDTERPIARYEPDTSNLNRRGRYGRNEGA